jgi:DNA-3-methyladenine glycosylase I
VELDILTIDGLENRKFRRCEWAKNELSIAYHDQEWGVPCHDDAMLFEFLILEGTQAGLSWDIVLKKRLNYREVFDQFDPNAVAQYDNRKVAALLSNPGIIRNRLKINATIQNAKAFRDVQAEFGSFATYLWGFVGGKPKRNRWPTLKEIPSQTPEGNALSKDLKRRGFKFVGPTICYAFMQAVGMVNDHTLDCFRHAEIEKLTDAEHLGE